jgi:hypothetical protein
MAGGDVEQRVLRLHEVGLGRAERRLECTIDVDVAADGRGRRERGVRVKTRREREQGGARAAALAAIAWLGVALLAGCALRPAEPPPVGPPPLLGAGIPLSDDPTCPRIAHIEVRKSERRLVARCDPGPVFVMKVALGRDPIGPKTSRGDNRTPEGSYVVSGPARRNRFHRFIPIDYPSRRDADAALASGAISPAEHARILARRAHDRPPPQNTSLGGGLGLHGEGKRWQGESNGLDWTFGCIAVRDPEIDFLAERVKVGTPVWIVP